MVRSIIACSIIAFSFTACNSDTEGNGNLMNGSFEQNGAFSLDGWTTTTGTESTDAPDNGGNFSLKLTPASLPDEGYAEYVIEGIEGAVNITLSVSIKSFGGWPGNLTLKKVDENNAVSILGVAASSDSNWVQKTISTSTTLNTGDVLIVKLSAGTTEIVTDGQYDLFDQVIFLYN